MGGIALATLGAAAGAGGATALGAGTAATLAAGVSGAASGLAAAGQRQQAEAAAKRAEFQAQVQRRNQEIAEQRAESRRERGRIEARSKRRETDRRIGSLEAGLAGRGVRVDTGGSAQDIFEGTREFGELDALTLRNNAEREALSFEQQADIAGAQANLFDVSAENKRSAGKTKAATTFLKGVGSSIAGAKGNPGAPSPDGGGSSAASGFGPGIEPGITRLSPRSPIGT